MPMDVHVLAQLVNRHAELVIADRAPRADDVRDDIDTDGLGHDVTSFQLASP